VSAALIIERDKPVGKVMGRGRKKGSGPNLQLLAKLKPGDSIWEVPEAKMHSLRASAFRAGIKVKVRLTPSGLYAIERLS
jgi:hypothetical protein